MRIRYPKLRLVYLSGPNLGGYAITGLNPEPAAYDSGYAVRGVIQDRIVGKLKGPWLGWGPYLWTDGLLGRSDGLSLDLRRRRRRRDPPIRRRRAESRQHADHLLQDGPDRAALVRHPLAQSAAGRPLYYRPAVKGPVGIVGAGYVGLPLAQRSPRPATGVVLVEANPEKVDAVNARRELHPRTSRSERLARARRVGSDRDHDGLRRAARTPTRSSSPADAAHGAAGARPVGRARRRRRTSRRASKRASWSCSRGRRIPGTTRERLRPCSRAAGSRRARTSTWRSRPSGSIPAARTGRPRPPRRSSAASRLPAPAGHGPLQPRARDRDPVSSPEAAELTKLLENIFRSVNIALVNELAMLCDRMGIDVWEVIDAAATKPFGFMASSRAPGSAATASRSTPSTSRGRRASTTSTPSSSSSPGKVNSKMPYLCVGKVARALNSRGRRSRARTC